LLFLDYHRKKKKTSGRKKRLKLKFGKDQEEGRKKQKRNINK